MRLTAWHRNIVTLSVKLESPCYLAAIEASSLNIFLLFMCNIRTIKHLLDKANIARGSILFSIMDEAAYK